MSWIQHPVMLGDDVVKILPLSHEHFPALVAIGRNPVLWEHLPIDGTRESELAGSLRDALLKRITWEQYPFVIIDRQTDKVIGSTRLFEIFESHKKLEIGWTWYAPEFWGKGHNTHCKLLLLQYCFEQLAANRVQLKTRTTNVRSMAAILKIGGVQEGVLRQDRIMPNGEVRDTVVFSIIASEWPAVKEKLLRMIAGFIPAG